MLDAGMAERLMRRTADPFCGSSTLSPCIRYFLWILLCFLSYGFYIRWFSITSSITSNRRTICLAIVYSCKTIYLTSVISCKTIYKRKKQKKSKNRFEGQEPERAPAISRLKANQRRRVRLIKLPMSSKLTFQRLSRARSVPLLSGHLYARSAGKTRGHASPWW